MPSRTEHKQTEVAAGKHGRMFTFPHVKNEVRKCNFSTEQLPNNDYDEQEKSINVSKNGLPAE